MLLSHVRLWHCKNCWTKTMHIEGRSAFPLLRSANSTAWRACVSSVNWKKSTSSIDFSLLHQHLWNQRSNLKQKKKKVGNRGDGRKKIRGRKPRKDISRRYPISRFVLDISSQSSTFQCLDSECLRLELEFHLLGCSSPSLDCTFHPQEWDFHPHHHFARLFLHRFHCHGKRFDFLPTYNNNNNSTNLYAPMFSQDSENRELKELQSINKLIYLKLNLRPGKTWWVEY